MAPPISILQQSINTLSRFILLLLLLPLLPGCASVSLVNTLRDQTVPAKQYKKLLVVGVTAKPQMRQVFDRHFGSNWPDSRQSGSVR